MFKKVLCLLIGLLFTNLMVGQQDINELSKKFDEMSVQMKGLNESIKIDVSGLVLHDFITSVAESHQLNVDVDPGLNELVVNNFYDITVKGMFIHFVQKYDLEVTFLNNIIIFKKRIVAIPIAVKTAKIIDVSYNSQNDFLSVKLDNDSLSSVVKAIVDQSNKNLVLAPDIKNTIVSSYILNRPFDQVIQMMSKSNGLSATLDENGFYYIQKNNDPNNTISSNGANQQSKSKVNIDGPGFFQVDLNNNGYLSVKANIADASDLLMEAAKKLNINYYLYNKPDNEKTTLLAENITFDKLLENIFKGKKYTFKKQGDVYIIGDQITEGLRATQLIQLENRSIESVLASLPKIFSEKLEIKEFIELNGLIVSGPRSLLEELIVYIHQIDKVVPMVQIEVIIVQYNKSYDIQTGMKAGLDKINKQNTGGTLFPTTDMTVNATSVNSLINAFNGLGIFTLGNVTSAFYLNLKLMENNSIIKIESTPKIATLSGHEARLSIGETSYYFEESNKLISNNNGTDILNSGEWKSTDANLMVSIKPFVSIDESVTLTISVEKSSFLARAGKNAPPGKSTQKFESLVRVKNNEMILLGGLDELKKENTGTGTPIVSRIPVISWFFSSKKKGKSNSKLHLFIKPTIVY